MNDYKKSATIGKYTIGVRLDGGIDVLVNGNPCGDREAKSLLRDQIATKLNFDCNPDWNTRQMGSKLVDFIMGESDCNSEQKPKRSEPEPFQCKYAFQTIGYEDEDRTSYEEFDSREEAEEAMEDFIMCRTEAFSENEYRVTEGRHGSFELHFEGSSWWYKMWIEEV